MSESMNVQSAFQPLPLHFLAPMREPRQAARRLVSCAAMALPLMFAGCASPAPASGRTSTEARIATHWHAPLPHGGRGDDLRQWWSQFDDPLVLQLIDAAQGASPMIAQATAQMADARAANVLANAARLPSLDGAVSVSRGHPEPGTTTATTSSLDVKARWELDLFGANRAGLDAARARLEASHAHWHDARVSVAAEVAQNYVELRACEAHVQQAELDATSRAQTFRLTDAAAAAGIRAPSIAALARASAEQGQAVFLERKAKCDLLVKALVALTSREEAVLRRELADKLARLPRPVEFTVEAVPAEALAQRPDIHAAAQDVIAASAASAQADARRWPRIMLTGSIGHTHVSGTRSGVDGTVWNIGPVAISFPLFDGGVRRADALAAQARYEAAMTVYAARLRAAIQEVESALVALESTAQRSERTRIAVDGFERSYRATAASYQAGLTSLFGLEDARRTLVAARSTLIEMRRERLLAWISLYRSLGGGWLPAPEPIADGEALAASSHAGY